MSLSKSRLMAIADIIPESPEQITVQEIKRELIARDLGPVTARTVQRDLNSIKATPLRRLSLVSGYVGDSRNSGTVWSWSTN